MMKNDVYFIVIALDLGCTLVIQDFDLCKLEDVTMWTLI